MARTTTGSELTGETVRNTWTSAILGGLAGGLVFGVLLQLMGMMPVIASLYGAESAAAGWVAHLFNSVVFGLLFAAAVVRTDYRDAELRTMTLLGAGYGVVLWIVAAAFVMPLWMDAIGLAARRSRTSTSAASWATSSTDSSSARRSRRCGAGEPTFPP